MKKRLFSGVQPSGVLHLGNYIGAIRQWIDLQKDYESFFCIVDLHAITVRQDPEKLHEHIREVAASYLACDVDPKQSIIFAQSQVPAHAQLAWVLNTFTPMGELQRMAQYKEKAKRQKKNVNAGLFIYPVLMAADILLYDTNVVPVGEDQTQHVELARNIASRFNHIYGREVFMVPKGLYRNEGARIMGLDDPSIKMSKSAGSEWNYIAFSDSPDMIRKKIKRAVTDSGKEVRAGTQKPALTNLLTIFSTLSGRSIEEIEEQYVGKGYAQFKGDLAEVVVEWLAPIQEKIKQWLNDHEALDAVLHDGADRARTLAEKKLREVYNVVGLMEH